MILEKFLLMFETDADEAKKTVKGFNDELDNTESSAEGAALSVGDLVSAFIALSTIKTTVLDSAFRTDTVGKFSETLGFNIEEMDAWGAAVERSGGSSDAFRGAVSALNDQLTDMALYGGGAAAETLARLGINATNAQGDIKGVFDLLPEIADSFQNISKEESFGLGKRLGLDQATILLLQQGRSAVSDLVEQQRQLGGMTGESYRASAEFNNELGNTGRAFDAVSQEANTKLLPFLSSMLRSLQDIIKWMREHREFMSGFFMAASAAITGALIPALKALAVTIKANPIVRLALIIGSIGTAFAALYEDVKRYTQGQSSFIGDLFEKYEWLEKGVIGAINLILLAWENLSNAVDWVGLLATAPLEALDQLKQGFLDLWNYITSLFDFSSLFDGLPSWLGGVGNDMIENTQAGIATAQQYAQNAVNSMTTNMMFNSSDMRRSINVSMGGVNVDARGMDQQQARGLFADEFKNQLSGAVGQLDDGVDR